MKIRRLPATRNLAIAIALAIVVAALFARAATGATKNDFHVDEGFTAAITNGSPMPWSDPVPRGEWLEGKKLFALCFSDALAARGSADLSAIARATAADVHPPLYYWALAIARVTLGPENFVFAGIAFNLLLFAISCALVTLIAYRFWKDWPVALLTLALFAFSSVSISLTVFIRMYELLQALCLSFLACASFVLFPPRARRLGAAVLPFSIAGLLVCAFLGLLTHYYFLLFVAPVAAFSCLYLALKKRPVSLLWGIFSVLVGLYLAYCAFPAMEGHLLSSYRAAQGFSGLANATSPQAMESIRSYFWILSRTLVPFPLVFAVIALAAFERIGSRGAGLERKNGAGFYARMFPPFVLAALIFAFTFSVIPISAPYRSARYIGAFYPEYALAFAGLVRLLLSKKAARVMLCVTVAFVVAHGINPANLNAFHEDYTVDARTHCIRDGKPLIIMTTGEGGSWRNLLPYVNAAKASRVFVATAPSMLDVSARLSEIARSSGKAEVYAIVDMYSTPPAFERIGHLGFFEVYRVPGK